MNGGAAGYGMDTAIGCDIRIMAESAKLAAAFVKRSVMPESAAQTIVGAETPLKNSTQRVYSSDARLSHRADRNSTRTQQRRVEHRQSHRVEWRQVDGFCRAIRDQFGNCFACRW